MKIKSKLSIIFTGIILFLSNNSVMAITDVAEKAKDTSAVIKAEDIKEDEAEIIKRFSFRDKFQRSGEAQIKSFYKDFNKYSQKNDIEKLKSMYADNYVNNDGFDKNTIFEMAEKASGAYKDVEYTTTIEKISINGNYAVVDVNEFAIGSTSKEHEQIGDLGLVSSDLYYTDYLRKEGNKWKITATEIKSEKVALKYGEAKSMPIDITAPKLIPAGSEYDVKITTDSPNGVLVLGSIVNEPIVYPQVQKNDVYKSIKSGILERVLKSNTDNHNEYAAVTIGITRASIEPPDVIFNMTGMAFVVTRVNVYNKTSVSKS